MGGVSAKYKLHTTSAKRVAKSNLKSVPLWEDATRSHCILQRKTRQD